ncbi:pyridoxamine 5'-phosphate oxidase family protein [bacterium]|nr:pyridoxamine 5'-phosphate oxidase family protein [bacterium]
MTRTELLAFLRQHRVAVQASVSSSRAPQAAVVGIAVSDDLEIVFDTLDSTRKFANLTGNPRIAFVVGGLLPGDERTVQYEGLADVPSGAELVRAKRVYFGIYPDGREREKWPGIAYVRARPTWIRYSDFNKNPPEIVEFDEDALRPGRALS